MLKRERIYRVVSLVAKSGYPLDCKARVGMSSLSTIKAGDGILGTLLVLSLSLPASRDGSQRLVSGTRGTNTTLLPDCYPFSYLLPGIAIVAKETREMQRGARLPIYIYLFYALTYRRSRSNIVKCLKKESTVGL